MIRNKVKKFKSWNLNIVVSHLSSSNTDWELKLTLVCFDIRFLAENSQVFLGKENVISEFNKEMPDGTFPYYM